MNVILKRVNSAALITFFVILGCCPILWSTMWRVRIDNILEEWKTNGPHNTMVGKLWSGLAVAGWLGPLRPRPPRDPLHDCGILDGKLVPTRRLENCLKKQIVTALQEHKDLAKKFLLTMFWIVYNNLHNIVMYWWRGIPDERRREENSVPRDTREAAGRPPMNHSQTK